MGSFLNLETRVNGNRVSSPNMNDPFELGRFPGAIDASRGRTLDRLGKDITVVARKLARQDPDIEDVRVEYRVENGNLYISSEQTHSTGYSALRALEMETGEVYHQQPSYYLLKATHAVLDGRSSSSQQTLADISKDMVKQWRSNRQFSWTDFKPSGAAPTAFNSIAALLAVGTAYYVGR